MLSVLTGVLPGNFFCLVLFFPVCNLCLLNMFITGYLCLNVQKFSYKLKITTFLLISLTLKLLPGLNLLMTGFISSLFHVWSKGIDVFFLQCAFVCKQWCSLTQVTNSLNHRWPWDHQCVLKRNDSISVGITAPKHKFMAASLSSGWASTHNGTLLLLLSQWLALEWEIRWRAVAVLVIFGKHRNFQYQQNNTLFPGSGRFTCLSCGWCLLLAADRMIIFLGFQEPKVAAVLAEQVIVQTAGQSSSLQKFLAYCCFSSACFDFLLLLSLTLQSLFASV